MKFTHVAEEIFGSRQKVRALRYLLRTNLELTGRQLSRAIGVHHHTCRAALQELASLGVVTMHQAGRAILYKVNPQNVFSREVLRPLFLAEEALLPQAVAMLLRGSNVRAISVIIFGSVAAAGERGTSDVDALFLVSTPADKKRLVAAIEKKEYHFILAYGNMLSALVLSMDEFRSRLQRKERLMEEIIRHGRPVYGKTIQEVLIACRQKE